MQTIKAFYLLGKEKTNESLGFASCWMWWLCIWKLLKLAHAFVLYPAIEVASSVVEEGMLFEYPI